MNWGKTPDELRQVPASAVRDYLTRRGWVPKPSPRPTSMRFEHPELLDDAGVPLTLYFPVAEQFADYPLRVLDFASAMASVQATSPDRVLDELTRGLPARQPVGMPGVG